MSTTIPLTYRVDYEIGLDAKDLTPIQVQELSAQQSIFSVLFDLIRASWRLFATENCDRLT